MPLPTFEQTCKDCGTLMIRNARNKNSTCYECKRIRAADRTKGYKLAKSQKVVI